MLDNYDTIAPYCVRLLRLTPEQYGDAGFMSYLSITYPNALIEMWDQSGGHVG